MELLEISPTDTKLQPQPTKRKRQRRLTDAEIDNLTTRHAAGWSQVQLARELGVNRKTIMRHLS